MRSASAIPRHTAVLPSRSPLLRYGVAVVVVGIVVAARLLFDPLLGVDAPLLPFTVAVMLAGWYGGIGPGLVATALSALCADFLWLHPTHSLWIEAPRDRLELGIFVGTGVAISALNEAIVVARGRSDRHSAELKEREEAHRRILETATEGIWTVDARGRVTFANASMSEMLGVPLPDLIGRNAREFVFLEDRGENVRRFGSILAGDRSAFDLRLRRTDGREIWAHVSTAPIPDARGRVVGALGMFTDVTARMHAESELQRLLESETKARADAEAANRAKDEFLATVSHELRTPLNAMLGWLTMLRSGALDATKTARAIAIIERNARSQAKLIEDLLDVSRMISGKLRLERRRVSLGAVVQSAIDTVGPTAVEKQIRIERRFDPGPDLVAGDPERLKQIVVNLLSNAVKFTPIAGRIRVAVERRAGQLVIEVEDTGQGIAPEFLPHVFDRFRQQDGGMTRKHAGLGLGLAIVRHLVELHGGSIAAHSEGPGKGSRFTCWFPPLEDATAEIPARETPAPNDARVSRPPNETPLRGAKVLVVDDEADSLEMLRELLSVAGADVRTASTAAMALPIVKTFRPSLLVSDLAMPEADGYELLAWVRALPISQGGATPAIALTAHARATDRLRVLSSGFQAYLAKPVEPDELIATAQRLVRQSEPRAAHP
ncbi:hybrid sensor histidine kinase/response regulator [Sandaracinus amylolyticus]|uniref:hybrid sensor histidine kinase/response regulator n=1 Tax=Sandaracinus amylolyticus TaxID=927083 RepID=UPI001F250DBE|nr:ATP-binding protein [Sandaracinus amylolyticus]UJR82046.1 NO-binding membrane sensor protein with MHYT domain [Sandaracinus amylolyticus]